MTDLRRMIGDKERPFLSNNDRIKSGRVKHNEYKEEGHHAYMRCMGGTEKSIVNLFQQVHYANHRLFGASNLTRKMLILAMMDEHTLNPEFVEELADRINHRGDDYVYKDGIYIRH